MKPSLPWMISCKQDLHKGSWFVTSLGRGEEMGAVYRLLRVRTCRSHMYTRGQLMMKNVPG
jgi:hypothetical protein